MVLGVLSNPGVTIVDVGGHDVLVDVLWHDHKPLGQEVSLITEINQKSLSNKIENCTILIPKGNSNFALYFIKHTCCSMFTKWGHKAN